jgi:hypothetical protein
MISLRSPSPMALHFSRLSLIRRNSMLSSCSSSGFIPRFVGIATIIAGCGYVISSSVSLFLPASAQGIGDLAMILGAGELAFFWLLIWGAKDQSQKEQPALPVAPA